MSRIVTTELSFLKRPIYFFVFFGRRHSRSLSFLRGKVHCPCSFDKVYGNKSELSPETDHPCNLPFDFDIILLYSKLVAIVAAICSFLKSVRILKRPCFVGISVWCVLLSRSFTFFPPKTSQPAIEPYIPSAEAAHKTACQSASQGGKTSLCLSPIDIFRVYYYTSAHVGGEEKKLWLYRRKLPKNQPLLHNLVSPSRREAFRPMRSRKSLTTFLSMSNLFSGCFFKLESNTESEIRGGKRNWYFPQFAGAASWAKSKGGEKNISGKWKKGVILDGWQANVFL